jgi:hypothetical protein
MTECAVAAKKFARISTGRVVNGCIGGIDGYIMSTLSPPEKYAANQSDFYNGNKEIIGVNIQGIANADCRFHILCIVGPGNMNSCEAVKQVIGNSTINNVLGAIPCSSYIVSDSAYKASSTVVPVSNGVDVFDA